MSAKKILTLAVLGTALVELLGKAKGLKMEPDLVAFHNDFEAFCNSPVEGDQAQIHELTTKIAEHEDLIERYKSDQLKAIGIITDLKGQLKKSQDSKAKTAGKPVVEVGGVKHVINHGAHPHSVQDLLDNPDLVKEILKIDGQQAITKV